uniref:Uncharacterized protein n=1 Tax=Cacopsylla melanoneura TaxID=428564 RepID=A0A8D8TPR8_9HEMI
MNIFESRIVLIVFGVLFQLSSLVSSLPKPCPKFDVPYGRTKYKSRGRVIRISCYKGYNLIGERTLLCEKGKWDSDIPVCAKPGCTLPEARIPNGKVMSSYNHQIIRTVCEDGFELQGSPVIFCNGIVWNSTLPMCLGKPGVKACDFEGKDQFCGWYQTRSYLGWQIGHDPLENWVSYWAPDFDHTFGLGSFGHYIHMKARNELTPYPASGQLKSPVYRKPDNPHVCFQFWFHVDGEEAGDLKVFVNKELYWSKTQINRKLWQRGSFHFVVNTTYQIMIEATIPSIAVTVALDDLEVMENCTKVTDYVLGTASSCEGRCGDDGYVDDCSCDYDCQDVDNCCPDFGYFCPSFLNASETTVVTETSPITVQNPDIPITTMLPSEESGTVPTSSATLPDMGQTNSNPNQEGESTPPTGDQAESENDQNNPNQTQPVEAPTGDQPGSDTDQNSQNQAQPVEANPNQNRHTEASENTPNESDMNKNNQNKGQSQEEQTNDTATTGSDMKPNNGSSNKESEANTTDRPSQNTPDTKGDNNVEKTNDIVEHPPDSKNGDTDVTVDESNLSTKVSREDDVGSVTTENVEPTLKGDQDQRNNEMDNQKVIVQNKTADYDGNENKTQGVELTDRHFQIDLVPSNGRVNDTENNVTSLNNDETDFGYNESSYQNVRTKENRIKGSIKKGTVVYDSGEVPINSSDSKIDLSKARENAENSSHVGTDLNPAENGVQTRAYNTVVIQNKTLSELKNSTSDIDNINAAENNTTNELKPSGSNKENPMKSNTTALENSGTGESITAIDENDSLPINTRNDTNENLGGNNNQTNRNITKIILYKSSKNENSTGIAANSTQHSDISRVQIHINGQANGQTVVENVKMNELGKYKESTIARLKQINEHIGTVIAKRNNSTDNSIIPLTNKNATALHKLKHFITTIIDSHNNSTLQQNVDKGSTLNSSENNVQPIRSIDGNLSDATNHPSTIDPINSEQSSAQNPVRGITNSANTSLEEKPDKLKETNAKTTTAQFGQRINEDTSKTVNKDTPKSVHTITSDGANRNTDIESLDYKIIDPSQNKTYYGPIKVDSSGGTSEGGDEIVNSSQMNNFGRNRNYYSGHIYELGKVGSSENKTTDQVSNKNYNSVINIKSILDSEQYPSTKNMTSTLSTSDYTPSKTSPMTRRYFNFPLTRNRSLVTTPRPRLYVITRKNGTLKLNGTTSGKGILGVTVSKYPEWRKKYSTSNTTLSTSTSQSTTPKYYINLLKPVNTLCTNQSIGECGNQSNSGDIARSTDQKYKYTTSEVTTSGDIKNGHIVIQAASTKNESHDSYIQQSSFLSLANVASFILVLIAILLSMAAAYGLVQKYRRKRGDDTEIEYLTGDELLYFHTPSPHLRSHRNENSISESFDEGRGF